mgnify:CR=1 FL=1
MSIKGPVLWNTLPECKNLGYLFFDFETLDIKNVEILEEGKTTTTSSIMFDIVRKFSSDKKVNLSMKTAGIYIHIPFCAIKCMYCDFTQPAI